MQSPRCWRCLRPSIAAPSPSSTRHLVPAIPMTTSIISTAHTFSTTAHPQGPGDHQRTGKRMQLSKFKTPKETTRGRAPLPGERKAMRKRVMLSNNNAIPVRGMESLDAQNMSSRASEGKVFKIPEKTIDQLRASEAFKSSQTWGLFHSPHILVRPETVTVCGRMLESAGKGETARMVIAGEKAAGKSTVLLQAMANAFLNGWIVINIPEAQDLTTACTEYAAIPDTNPQQWMQSVYALKLMQNIRMANRSVLDRVYTTSSYEHFTNPVAKGATLNALIESAREPDQAWPIFAALWHELVSVKADQAGNPRPPMLLALDGLAFIMKISDYRNTAFELIHSHDLAIVRMFVDVLSGKTPLPAGGAAIAATCRSNAPRNASLELAIERQLARQQGVAEEELPPRDPYCKKYDPRVDGVMEGTGLEVSNVRGISKKEARSLMEYWAASGILRAQVDEKTVSEKWITGGNGIIGEMEKAGLLSLRL